MNEPRDQIPLIAILARGKMVVFAEMQRRLAESGFDIREGHGCVFGFIDDEGTRLTELAERSGFTKQSVGEAASDLEARGYLERVPDPTDGRAKLLRLTTKGIAARDAGYAFMEDIERTWAERYGEEKVAALREVLEGVLADYAGTAPRM